MSHRTMRPRLPGALRIGLVTLLLLCALPAGPASCSPPAALAAAEGRAMGVRLRVEAVVSGPQIRLADVAEFVEGDRATWESVRELAVATAPLPGDSRWVSRGAIELRLRQAKAPGSQVQWADGPEGVMVRRLGQVVAPGAVRNAIVAYLAAHQETAASSYSLASIDLTGLPELAPGEPSARVTSGPPVLRPGPAVFVVELTGGGNDVRRVWVKATLAAEPGPEARSGPAEPGRASDEAPAGMKVRAGAGVTIVLQAPGVTIRAPGMMEEEAAVGSWASVRSLASGTILRALLVSPELAVVDE